MEALDNLLAKLLDSKMGQALAGVSALISVACLAWWISGELTSVRANIRTIEDVYLTEEEYRQDKIELKELLVEIKDDIRRSREATAVQNQRVWDRLNVIADRIVQSTKQ